MTQPTELRTDWETVESVIGSIGDHVLGLSGRDNDTMLFRMETIVWMIEDFLIEEMEEDLDDE